MISTRGNKLSYRSRSGFVTSKGRLNNPLNILATFILIFFPSFLLAFVIGSNFAPVSNSSATGDISVVNNVTGYYANITSSGDIELDISTSPDGDYKTGVDTLSVDTNTRNGYKLYISTIDHSSDSPALPSGTPANGLINSATGSYISPSSGTVNAPVRLATNTWGYTASRSTNTGTKATYTNTAAAPTEAAGGQAVWKAVPTYGSEDIFYTNADPTNASSGSTTPGDDNDTNTIDVYYAASANTGLSSGIYTNTVVYTAIVDGGFDETGLTEASIFPAIQEGLSAGAEVTIATGLYPGLSSPTATELSSFLGAITVTIGGQNCADITPFLTEIGSLNLTCDVPAQSDYGAKDVVVSISKYGKTYTIVGGYEYSSAPGFFRITRMQDMTHEICMDSRLPTPSASETVALTVSAWQSGSRTGVPTTTLLDDRAGQKSYTVKKLADGKCWMTENLALPAGAVLNASNSDLDGTVVTSYTLPSSSAPFSTNSSSYDLEQVNSGYTDTTSYDPNGYKAGNYYSWRAATAGTGRGSSTSNGAVNDPFGQNMNTDGNNTLVSICPKGWRLPTGGTGNGTTDVTSPGSATNLVNGDFYVLYQAYGYPKDGSGISTTSASAKVMFETMTLPTYAPNISIVGYFRDQSTPYSSNKEGLFWASTVRLYGNAYNLWTAYMVSGSTAYYYNSPSTSSQKYFGDSVRCVAR